MSDLDSKDSRAIAQAVTLNLKAELRVRSQASPRGICKQSVTGTGFCVTIADLHTSITAPMLHIRSFITYHIQI